MRAVNLIPRDSRRTGLAAGGIPFGPGYVILLALAIAVVLVTVLVVTNNTIATRQAKLASLRSELAADQTVVARLGSYQRFAQLAQARITTVRDIVSQRFDWHAALGDLSRVVPPGTTLQTVNASASPGSGGSTSSLRGDITSPAFDLTGCTGTQDDVARLMSRLRAMDEVTRVALESTIATSGPSTGGSGTCTSGPTFHIVVWFAAPGSTGLTSTGTSAGGAG